MTPEEIKLQEESKQLLMDIRSRCEDLEKHRIKQTDFTEFKAKIDQRLDGIDLELAKVKTPELWGVAELDTKKIRDAYIKAVKSNSPAAVDAYYGMLPPEAKAITLADSTHSGVLAPYDYQMEIIKNATVFSPIRSLARVIRTNSYAVELPTETGVGTPVAVAESGTASADTSWTHGLTEIKTFEPQFLYQVTRKILEDSAFNLEAELADYYGRRFGVWEGTQFISGDGTTEPTGIITNAATYATHNHTDGSNAITVTDLLDVQYTLPSPYAPNATWLMHRKTVGYLMALKNATTNAYLLQPEMLNGYPMRLLGSPVVECPDMPSALADAECAIVYGDIRAGYCIVDRLDMSIQRLNELYAVTGGYIGFLGRRRVGGNIIREEAMVPMLITA